MKKCLLLSGLILSGTLLSNAFEAPQEFGNHSFQGISPNGRYIASSLYGTVVILDLQTGEKFEYVGDELSTQYSEGLGNYVSDTGVVLGATSSHTDAAYWENGQWHRLKVDSDVNNNLACGITPDASRICGSVGVAAVSIEHDNLMLAPAYWDRLPDGSYSECHMLPYPETDFTGRTPQYITAISISRDGKTIVGQVQDCVGMLCSPIVYRQDDNGDWTYTQLLQELINPDNVVFPEYPGDGPKRPSMENYMTDENKAAYQAALQAYYNSGYDWSLYPNEEDYLDEAGKAAYDADMEVFNAENLTWSAAYNSFMDLYYSLLETAPQTLFNAIRLSPDGSTVYTTNSTEDHSDPMSWFPKMIYTPWAVDVETGEVTDLGFGMSLQAVSVPADGVLLASNGVGATPMEGYIIADGKCTPIHEYLAGFSPELKTWMDQNLTHNVETGYDPDTFDSVFEEMIVTGMPLASADLKTVAFWNDCPWGYDYAYGYIFDLSQFAGIDSTVSSSADDVNVSFDAAGNLTVTGDVDSVALYDLSGRCVFAAAAPRGTVACPLGAGVYVARALTPAGARSFKLAR